MCWTAGRKGHTRLAPGWPRKAMLSQHGASGLCMQCSHTTASAVLNTAVPGWLAHVQSHSQRPHWPGTLQRWAESAQGLGWRLLPATARPRRLQPGLAPRPACACLVSPSAAGHAEISPSWTCRQQLVGLRRSHSVQHLMIWMCSSMPSIACIMCFRDAGLLSLLSQCPFVRHHELNT